MRAAILFLCCCCASAVVVWASMGCGKACTLIGCSDALALTLKDSADQPVSAFSGALTFAGHTQQFACPAQETSLSLCESGGRVVLQLQRTLPTQVTLSVVSADGGMSFAGELVLSDRTESYPNGEGCGGPCTSARAEVTLTP